MTHNKQTNIDLHCHLDGSLQVHFVQKVLQETRGEQFSQEQILQKMQAPADCSDLTTYLQCFDLPVACMQTVENIIEGSQSFVHSLVADDVMYAEVRFSPVLFMQGGLSERDALEAVLQGLAQGSMETGILTNTIVCGLRHFEEGVNEASFRLAREYLGHGICAVDLAGDESGLPNYHFANLFALAKDLDLPFTIHAGECGDVQSVVDAIAFGARRIGHGIAMAGHPDVQTHCKACGIGVELCPTSNFQTKAVKDAKDYPLEEFLKADMLVSINTDNRTVSNTTLKQEFALLQSLDLLTLERELTLRQNAIVTSFASEAVKHQLWKKL